jgi:hypothetical protein
MMKSIMTIRNVLLDIMIQFSVVRDVLNVLWLEVFLMWMLDWDRSWTIEWYLCVLCLLYQVSLGPFSSSPNNQS